MIDLSTSWNATKPAYKQLPTGPAIEEMPSVMTSDGRWVVIDYASTVHVFDTKKSTWNKTFAVKNFNTGVGNGAVFDPDSGSIYIPNGYLDAKNQVNALKMNLDTRTTESVRIYPTNPSSLGVSAAWSQQFQKLIAVGGYIRGTFSWSTVLNWTNMTQHTTGTTPPGASNAQIRTLHCLTPAYGGSKMILFGGKDFDNGYRDIYVLDVATFTWTKGPDIDQGNARDSAACAFSNDQFIVWGGSTRVNATQFIFNNKPLIYNLKTKSWTSQN
ncbi:hypothetical protein BGZ54_007618 [Gamsiella multidivaricata]|nr:hypothetical protein BGZ54_007618 [Gamsiella multidivaricata]